MRAPRLFGVALQRTASGVRNARSGRGSHYPDCHVGMQLDMKRKSKVVMVMVVFLLMLSAASWMHTQLSIDGCLDQGGRWNDEISQCENS